MANTEQQQTPPFNMATSQMSDEEFKKHISFLNLLLPRDEFSSKVWKILQKHGIVDYKTFFSTDINLDKRIYEGYFSFKISVPMIYNEAQLELLKR